MAHVVLFEHSRTSRTASQLRDLGHSCTRIHLASSAPTQEKRLRTLPDLIIWEYGDGQLPAAFFHSRLLPGLAALPIIIIYPSMTVLRNSFARGSKHFALLRPVKRAALAAALLNLLSAPREAPQILQSQGKGEPVDTHTAGQNAPPTAEPPPAPKAAPKAEPTEPENKCPQEAAAKIAGRLSTAPAEFLSTIINSLRLPLYVINADTYEIVMANEEARRLGGGEIAATCYKMSHGRDAPCDGTDHPCPLELVLSTDGPFSTEHTHTHPNGETYFVELHAYPIRNSEGRITHILEYSRDITHRRRQELLTLKFTQAVDQLPVSIALTDTAGRIEFANRAYESRVGHPRTELFGNSFVELEIPDKDSALRETLCKALKEGKSWNGQFSRPVDEATMHWEQVVLSPVKEENGAVKGYILIAKDISIQMQREAELEKARQAAEDANHLKSHFLANISHELRTPLNIILGFSELLIQSEKEGDRESQLHSIRSAGKKLLTLIEDILDVAQIEAQGVELQNTPFSMPGLINDLSEEFGQQAQQKGLRYSSRIAADAPRLLVGDERRLQQVLRHLLSNALKFTHSGEISLMVEATTDGIRIVVSDTGIGFSSENTAILFQTFEQIDKTPRRSTGGAGLGLSLCRSIVEKMGGHITAEGEPNQGASFSLRLPLSPDHRIGGRP